MGTGKNNHEKGKNKKKISLPSALHNLIKHFLILSLHRRKRARYVPVQWAKCQQGKEHVQCMSRDRGPWYYNLSLCLETDPVNEGRWIRGHSHAAKITLDSNEIALASYTPLTQRGGQRVTNYSALSAQSSGLFKLFFLPASFTGNLTPLASEKRPFSRHVPSHLLSIA